MNKFLEVLFTVGGVGILGIYLGSALNLEGYLGIVLSIAVMGAFVVDAIEKRK